VIDVHGLQNLEKKECQEMLVDAVNKCVDWMEHAESLQRSLEGELNTARALTQAEKADKEFYKNKLEDANAWWRSPGFVIPTTMLITILGAMQLRH
jgi:hypothetical protein